MFGEASDRSSSTKQLKNGFNLHFAIVLSGSRGNDLIICLVAFPTDKMRAKRLVTR